MHVGLFFGSFNPIHLGHLTIAKKIILSQITNIEEVWFVISPQNPLKNTNSLLPIELRLAILEKALSTEELQHCKICDIELQLPKPSYTIDTLKTLEIQYPYVHFFVIIGEDCLEDLSQWKDFETLSQRYQFIVYPRFEKRLQTVNYSFVTTIDTPLLPISSTTIRENIKQGLSIEGFIPKNCISLIYYAVGLQLWQHGHLSEAYNAIKRSVENSHGEQQFSEALLLLQQILNFEKEVPETF